MNAPTTAGTKNNERTSQRKGWSRLLSWVLKIAQSAFVVGSGRQVSTPISERIRGA